MIRGVDVSHYQGDVNWHALKAKHGLSFGVFKATEGLSFEDPKAAQNRKRLIAEDMAWGAYHYAHPESDCNRQVDLFLRAARPVPGESFLVLDTERGFNAAHPGRWVSQFGDRLRKLEPGVTTVAYLGGFASTGTGKGQHAHFDYWWLPRYNVGNHPWPSSLSRAVPAGGNTTGWKAPHIWQWTAGLAPGLDANISPLSLSALLRPGDHKPAVKPDSKKPGATPMHLSLSTTQALILKADAVATLGFEREVADPSGFHKVGYHPTFAVGPLLADVYAAGTLASMTTGRVRVVEVNPQTPYAIHKAHPWHEFDGDQWDYSRPAARIDKGKYARLQIQVDSNTTLTSALVQANYTKG
jgi:GH25 family lysozyme M1 (1,4-beta-N-acetylmuramidase)